MNVVLKAVFVVGILCLIGSMVAVLAGNEKVAGLLAFAALAAVAVGLIYVVVTG